MTTEKLKETIRAATDTEPLFIAFMTLLKMSLDAETEAALDCNVSPDIRAYECGRASSIRDVLDEVEDIRSNSQ